MRIRWSKIWKDFEHWHESIIENDRCKHCGRTRQRGDWGVQKKKIQHLLEEEINGHGGK